MRAIAAVLGLFTSLGCGGDVPMTMGDGGSGERDTAEPVRCDFEPGPAEMLETPTAHTPRWAFLPWVSKDISDRDDTFAFVDGFESREIPVGVVVLDSPWETNYNSLVPNPERYADFAGMVGELRSRGIRTVVWLTQMSNVSSFDSEDGGDVYRTPSPNLAQARACGFLVNDGDYYSWWKGVGTGVDFFDEGARQWWHRQQDPLYDVGIAGWKLDFGEQYITSPLIRTDDGDKTLQQYSEEYYADFFRYGAARVGLDEVVIMARPYDRSYGFEGRFYARPEHATALWVGDNRRDWIGLVDALDHIFRSASAGYVNLGSDIGGYLDRDDENITDVVPASQTTFARWTAMAAMTPFMQLHGRANLTPWTVEERPDETVELYRYWATLHTELVPFWYSLAEAAYAGGVTIVRPVGATEADWTNDWRFGVGEAFLVAPILDDSGVRDIELPAGERWYDWWAPLADAVEGGTTLLAFDATDRRRIPLFVREGAIIPAEVSSGLTGLGSAASRGRLTVVVYPAAEPTRFVLLEQGPDGDVPVNVGARADRARVEVSFDAPRREATLRVRTGDTPTAASVDGVRLTGRASRADLTGATEGWWYDPSLRATWVRMPRSTGPTTLTLTL